MTWSAVNRYPQSAGVTRVVLSREHRLRGRWGQKSRCIWIFVCIFERIWQYKQKKRDRINTLAVYILVTSARMYSLHCCIHSHHILAHWHTPLPYTNLQTPNPAQAYKRLHNSTNTRVIIKAIIIIIRALHAYPTYIIYTYKTTKHCIPTLPLHTYATVTIYTTPTTPTTQHTLFSTLRIGPAPAHMLNEHVVGQWGCYLSVIVYYVLQHILAILLCLKMFRASCKRTEC